MERWWNDSVRKEQHCSNLRKTCLSATLYTTNPTQTDITVLLLLNTLRTGDADLRFCITTAQDG